MRSRCLGGGGGEAYLQYTAFMQLLQLENAVLTSVIWPWASVMASRCSRAGRRLADSRSLKPSTTPRLRLFSMATSTDGIVGGYIVSASGSVSATSRTKSTVHCSGSLNSEASFPEKSRRYTASRQKQLSTDAVVNTRSSYRGILRIGGRFRMMVSRVDPF